MSQDQPIQVRAPQPEEFESFVHAMAGPFGFDLPDNPEESEELLARMRRLFEPDRARCAYDGSATVGTLGVFSFEMSTPGGFVPVAGTTQVTVQVTHRRRGVLSSMMRSHLDEAVERGDAAAALWASDSAIYGRFGFGMATHDTDLEIDRRHIELHRLAPPPSHLEMVDAAEARRHATEVYERMRHQIPGMMSRSEPWWDRVFSESSWSRGGATKARHAVAIEDGRTVGWVRYRLKDADVPGDGHPQQDVRVTQLFGETPGAWAALWTHVLSHDLGRRIKAGLRPVDDPIHSLLRGPRRVQTKVNDGLWVRILDVEKMLTNRTYASPGSVDFALHDSLGYTSGTYRLVTDQTGSSVERCDRSDLEIDVEDLSALSLGGRSATELAAAGRIRGDRDAIVRLDHLLRGDRAPWCPEIF